MKLFTETSNDIIVIKKPRLPRGFMTSNGEPTPHAVMCYYIFFVHGGKITDTKIPQETLRIIREYYGWEHDSGFEAILNWGLNYGCGKSTTSNLQYKAMNKALHLAEIMYKGTVVPSQLKLAS
jgi:hypothetical protein